MMEETPLPVLRAEQPDVLWVAYAYDGLDGYAYVFPKTRHVNVGIGCLLSHFDTEVADRPYTLQERFVTSLVARGVLHGSSDRGCFTPFLIPVGGPLSRAWHEGVLFAGDAGGFVNAITAEGIYYAMVSGELAGQAIAAAHRRGAVSGAGPLYERAWQAELGTELRDAVLVQRYLFSSHPRVASAIHGGGSHAGCHQHDSRLHRRPAVVPVASTPHADALSDDGSPHGARAAHEASRQRRFLRGLLMRRLLHVAVLLLSCAVSSEGRQDLPAIAYRVSFPAPEHHWLEVEVTFRAIGTAPLRARMSRSSPGRYAVHEFAKNVFFAEAFDGTNRALAIARPDADEWQVSGHDGTVRLVYRIFGDHADGTYMGVDTTHAHLNMPATFMWAIGLEMRPIRVTFVLPAGSAWKAATQLYPTPAPLEFTAPNLQYFMDSPIELSDVPREHVPGRQRQRRTGQISRRRSCRRVADGR